MDHRKKMPWINEGVITPHCLTVFMFELLSILSNQAKLICSNKENKDILRIYFTIP